MRFEILYCRPCRYLERAESLAAELREHFGAEVSVREGGFGQFDVLLDGTLVASKGGLLRRMFIHGAPPEQELLETIAMHVALRDAWV